MLAKKDISPKFAKADCILVQCGGVLHSSLDASKANLGSRYAAFTNDHSTIDSSIDKGRTGTQSIENTRLRREQG
jgi:hypothetical protein